MVDWLNQILGVLNDWLYTYILIALLIIAGLLFTFRTGFVQFRYFFEGWRVVLEKKPNEKSVSSFQALMISTASRVGTGNIAGVATAIALGGPGAVFWMWLLAIIGSASAFIESTLAQIYKTRDGSNFRGGPAYYIQTAMKKRWLGVVFAIFLIACFAYGFNPLQAYNVGSALEYYIPDYYNTIAPAIVGGILALLTAITIFGGVHRIGNITSGLVPVMAMVYIALSVYVMIRNFGQIPAAFAQIFENAFDIHAIFGGFTGSCVMQGVKRGLFSNEAGMGSAPNAAATAEVSHPAKQGLVQMLSVFIDTILICSASAMLLLLSGVQGSDALKGMPYVQAAVFAQVGSFGIHFITISIFLFAFSSLVGNYYYTESNLKFIKDNKILLQAFRCTVVAMVFLGTQMSFDLAWNLADVLMGLMALVNLFALFCLGGIAVRALKNYTAQRKAGEEPTFRAADIGISDTEFWK